MIKFLETYAFTPINTLIFFITIISFIVALIVFFELVLTNYPIFILDNKLEIVTIACKQSSSTNAYIQQQVANYFQNTQNIQMVENEIQQRKVKNFSIFQKQVLPYLLVVFFLFVIFIIWFSVKGKKIEKIDYLLILFAVLSFLVEIIFYFMVLYQWEFISDSEFIKILLQ
jgi:cell division protein FtsL